MNNEDLVRTFDAEYEQMLSDMFDWPWPDAPEDYTPLPTIPPEENEDIIPQRSHNLLTMMHGSKAGRMLITDMEDSHLENCIAYYKRTDYPNNQYKLHLMLEEQNIRRLEEQNESLFGRSQR